MSSLAAQTLPADRDARSPTRALGRPPRQESAGDNLGVTGELWIDPAFRGELAAAGWTTFGELWATPTGQVLRSLPDRENRRLTWPALDAQTGTASGVRLRAAYLKKHLARQRRTGRRPWLRWSPGPSPARVEALAATQLAESGLPTVRVIAWGEGRDAEGWPISLVLVEELAGYTQLDHFLRREFRPQATRGAGPRDERLRRLLAQVAEVARRLHQAGWTHADLYCCHFFVREEPRGEFDVRLIDLQRARHGGWWRRRRVVKDLAQLAYSAPAELIGPSQCWAWLRVYGTFAARSWEARRLARQVWAKKRRMEHHLGYHP